MKKLILNLTEQHDKSRFFNQNQTYRLLVKAATKTFFTLLNLAQKTLDKSIKKQCVLSLYLRLYIKTCFLSFNKMMFSQTLVQASDMKREGFGSDNHQGVVKMFVRHFSGSRLVFCLYIQTTLFTNATLACTNQFACACRCLATKGGFSCPG